MPPPLGGPVWLRRSSGRRTTTCRCSPRCAAATVTDAPPTGCCQPNPSLPMTNPSSSLGWMDGCTAQGSACAASCSGGWLWDENGYGWLLAYSTSHLMAASSPLRAMAAVGLFFDAMGLGESSGSSAFLSTWYILSVMCMIGSRLFGDVCAIMISIPSMDWRRGRGLRGPRCRHRGPQPPKNQ